VNLTGLTLSPTAINENGLTVLNGTFTDTNSGAHTVTINWGDATTTTLNLDAAATSFSSTHTYKDDPTGTSSDVYTVNVSVTDNIGTAATGSATVTVSNVNPVVSSVTGGGSVALGDPATVTANFTDVGTLDQHTCVFAWGDGSTETISGSGSCSAPHTYSVLGSYTVNVTVTDDDGGSATGTKVVLVNAAPVISAVSASPNPVGENVNTILSGSFTDEADAGTHTVTIVWGDGTSNTTLNLASGVVNFSATHKFPDDNPTVTPSDIYTVSVTVKDSSNATDTESTTVTVNNSNPSISNVKVNDVNNANTVLLGSSATVKVTFTDPSTQDTHMCQISWADGTSPDSPTPVVTSGADSCTAVHTYAASGVYIGTATVTDDDGGVKTASFTVRVTVAPTVSAVDLVPNPNPVNENTTMTFTGTFVDPDAGETHKVTIVWGDGTANTVINNIPAGVLTFSATHKYLDDNPTATASDNYNITVTVTDVHNASSGPVTTSVTVANTAPVITSTDPTGSLPLWVDFTDAGIYDTHTATIDWGDGVITAGVVNGGNGIGYITGPHSFATPGPHTVTVTITDDDGGTTSRSYIFP
jgi:hypothetical protein